MNDDEQLAPELDGEELRRWIASSPEERLGHFVETCRQTGQVWTVGSGEELVVLAGENDEPFVVAFPHPEYGQDWFTTTDLDEVDLVAVGTEDWTDEILPGLAEAGISVLIFPTSEGDGSLMSAEDLAALLSREA